MSWLLGNHPSSAAPNPPQDGDNAENVENLRHQLSDIQRKLQKALGIRKGPPNKDAGHADVDFVQTKPSKRGALVCKKKNVKRILHGFHVDFPEGCVTALMGPSGAGKTTLLDFLTGMLGDAVHASGTVALPDDDAYVPQDDRLHSFYTCQAYMKHYARLKGMQALFDCCASKKVAQKDTITIEDDLEGDSSLRAFLESTPANKDDVDDLIAGILSEVGLSAQMNTVVGGLFQRGLSGGQKRRLSVALEVLSSPLNLFLDEPTSGLDSESALGLLKYLHSYARGKDRKTGKGRRVILTIHQPSSQIWENIDNVVLLAEGRLIYQGLRREMDDFFAACGHPVPLNYNPADHVIEVLTKMPEMDTAGAVEVPPAGASTAQMWSRCFKKWTHDESEADPSSPSLMGNICKSSVLRKVPVEHKLERVEAAAKKSIRTAIELTRRSFTSFRNPVVLGFRIAVYTAMSTMIGIIFFQLEGKSGFQYEIISTSGLLFFIVGFFSTLSLAQLPFTILDRGIAQKEVRNHLFHPAFNHASQAFTSVVVCLILAAIVAGIVLGMTGIKASVLFWINIFLLFICADAMTMLISYISPDLISAICISSGIMGLFSMVMGFLVLQSQLPVFIRWLYYVPFMTYSFRSLMYNEYSGTTFNFVGDGLDGIHNTTIPASITNRTNDIFSGDTLLKSFDMQNVNMTHDMFVLLGWACITHAISLLFLSLTHNKNKRMFFYSDRQ